MTIKNKISQTTKYQKDSIVSNEILSKKNGSITLFAFAKGQGLSEHTTPYDALVIIVDGSADISLAGETQQVGNGEMLLMPAGVPHKLYATQAFKMILIMIKS